MIEHAEQLDFLTRPQRVHAHSRASLTEERETGRAATRRALILCYLAQQSEPQTDRQIMRGLHFTEPNQVRPRINELIGSGDVLEVDSAQDPETHKTVRRVALTAKGRANL
jgi:hypothetical protein